MALHDIEEISTLANGIVCRPQVIVDTTRGRRQNCGLDRDEIFSLTNRLPDLDSNVGDATCHLDRYVVFHLHRFEHDDDSAYWNLCSDLHHSRDGPLKR
jgi:hypothetical protein